MRPSTWSALPLLLVLTLATAQHEFRFEPGHSLDNLWNMAIPRFGIGPSFSESGDGARGIVYTDLIRSSDGRFLYVCNAMLDKLVVIERNVHTGELLPIQGWEIVITSHLDEYEQVGVNSNGFVMTHDEQHVYVADSGYIPSTIYHFVRDPTTGLLSYFDAEIGCDFDDPVEFDPTEVDLGPLALEPILAKGKAKAKPQTVARVNVGDNGEGGNQCHDASARSYLAISDDDQLLFMSNTPVGQCSEVPSKSSHRIWSLARFSNGTLTDAQSLALGNDEISVPPGAMAWHNGRLVVSHHPSTAYNTCNSGKDVVDTTFIYIYDLETNGTGTRSLHVNDSQPLECTRIPSSSVIPGCSAGGFAFSPARTELYVFRQTHDARSSWEIDGLYVNASGLQFFNLALHDEPFIPPILAKDHDGEEDIRPLEVVPENMREAAEMTTIFRMAADSFSTNVVTWREQPFVHDVCVSEHFFYVSYSATLSGLRFVQAGGDMAELFSLVIYRRDPELGTVTYVQAIPHQWRIGAMDCDDNGVTAATPHGVRVYNLVDAIIDGLEYEVTEAVYRLDVPITPNQPIVSGGNPALFTASPQLPDGLRLDPATGVISGTPTRKTLRQTVMISAGNFNPSANAHTLVTITVQDHLSPCDYQGREYQVRVGESITIPTPSSAVAVTQVDFEVLPPLPPGLALDVHTGDITGTPQTEIPLTNYVVTCAAFGDVQTATVPITVLPAPPSSVSYEIPSMKLELGEPIQRNRVIFSGGRPTFFHSSDIPVGLSVHPVFGYIQGTPEDLTEETEITISYGDDEVNSGDISLLVEVYHKPPTQFTYRNPIAELVVDEEAPPMVPLVTGMGMKFSVDPALPEGLSLDEDTGTISGTPTELSALSGYLVLAWNSEISDGDGARPRPTHVREQLVYISVNTQQPSSFTYSHPNAVYVRGQPITTNVASIAGSAAVFDFRVSPALPTGLLLQANGDITGTPTVVVLPNAAFSIEARNGNNVIRATVALKIVERAPTTISYARTNAAYTVNDPIGENLPVVNEAVDSFSVNTRLPDGLELSPVTGAISGTPTSLQSSRTYVITATNSGGSSSTPLVISVLRNRPRNLTYTYDASQHTFTPSNLGGEILRYVVEPALPFGLILNSKTGQIYGRTLVDVPENQQYTVVGFNEAGSVSRVVDLTVSASAPPLPEAEIKQLHYLYTEATLTIGEAITDNIVISAPIDTIFELDPESQMPLGLNLDTATGTISGTPTIAMPETSNLGEYRVKVIVHCGPYSAHIFYTVPPLPPTIVYDPDEVVFYRGTTIPSVVPITGGGRITVPYTITPAFEFGNGLRFESTRGHINGNPRSVQSKVTYTVTARNSGGLGVGKISITVLERPPVISYTDEIFLQVGRTMTPLAPDTSAGGDVEEYSIIPDLPKGLTLSTTSGVISGAPTATFFQAAFVVTARNSGGSSTASFRLGVTVDGLSEANRFTTVDPISKDTQAETAAGISLTLIFFAFAILLLAFIAWRARNRKTTWQVAREKRDLRLAKALQRYESMVELARQQAAAEEAQRLERERLEAERRKRPLPRNQIPTIPARMIDLFKKLYIPIKLADPLIRENIKVLDLPHLKEDELQRFLPVRKYYRALLKYVENVLIPHVLPSDVLNGSTSSSEDYDDDADLSFSEV